jgi:hypothetical protein
MKMKKKEELLQQCIVDYAEQMGLTNDNVEPIVDGTYDINAYFQEETRIMWMLKEPYDEFLEDGTPYGGGWNMAGILDSAVAAENKTRKPMIYILYAFFNDIGEWDDMYNIEDAPEMAEVLKRIAYINMSKMPAKTSSKSNMNNEYKIWEPILLKQIELYDPHIIIFGNTFKYFKDRLLNGEYVSDTSNENLGIYSCNNRLYLDAYHPQQRTIKQEEYVNDILFAMRKYMKK